MTASDIHRDGLKRHLVDRYDMLVRALSRTLGSNDHAREALHETYLRLEKDRAIGPVRDPAGYLLRMATNLVRNQKAVERSRGLSFDEQTVISHVDDRPDQHRVAEARDAWRILEATLDAMPERRRDIFLSVWIDEQPQRSVADRWNISVRMVQYELARALASCSAVVGTEN